MIVVNVFNTEVEQRRNSTGLDNVNFFHCDFYTSTPLIVKGRYMVCTNGQLNWGVNSPDLGKDSSVAFNFVTTTCCQRWYISQ